MPAIFFNFVSRKIQGGATKKSLPVPTDWWQWTIWSILRFLHRLDRRWNPFWHGKVLDKQQIVMNIMNEVGCNALVVTMLSIHLGKINGALMALRGWKYVFLRKFPSISRLFFFFFLPISWLCCESLLHDHLFYVTITTFCHPFFPIAKLWEGPWTNGMFLPVLPTSPGAVRTVL